MSGRILLSFAAATCTILVAIGLCLASRADLAIREIAVIEDSEGDGERRVLIEYEIPDSLTAVLVIHAELRGQVAATAEDSQRIAEIEAAPVLLEWDASTVGWSFPWSTPDWTRWSRLCWRTPPRARRTSP